VSEAWEVLWDRAMSALDSLQGFSRVDWAFGGGTAMRLAYDHRESKDIDIFLNDAMVLNGLSPRLNDVTATLTPDYTEQSNYMKFRFAEGEVDFILGSRLLRDVPYARRTIRHRDVAVEQPVEIVAKKCFYRAADFAVRDVFDLAVLLSLDRASAESHAHTLLAKRGVLQQRIEQFAQSQASRERFRDRMNLIATAPQFSAVKDSALDIVGGFVGRA
jgi:hypothetical protein